jgi:hypothetical protein
MPDTCPLPYCATKKEFEKNGLKTSNQEYETFFETHSMAKGFLLAHGVNKDWGLFDEIKKIYNIPTSEILHDHNPVNDAYTIAFNANVLFGLCANKYEKVN